MRASATAAAAFDPNGIVVGGFDHKTEKLTIVSGATVLAGDVLGKITSGGKLKLAVAASEDGSEVPYAIALEDVDAAAGDKPCIVLMSGGVDTAKLRFGASITAASSKDVLQGRGLYLL